MTGPWPAPAGLTLDMFGPDDGTALGAVLLDCARVQVIDGADRLTLELECAASPAAPRSGATWAAGRRDGPYRSVGIEPMLGAAFDLADAGPSDTAVVPPTGEVTWRLTISAHRNH